MTTPLNSVVWFELYVNDLAKARAFYQAVFKIELQALDVPESEGPPLEMLAFPMTDNAAGAAGALVKMEGAPSGPGGTIVYFTCKDCAEEASRIAENGGTLVREKFSIGPYGYIALANDPDGNMIGLHSTQ